MIWILPVDKNINFYLFHFFSYDTANAIHADETGYVKNLGVPDQEIQTAQGSFSYKDDQNNQYYITYTADENGFQPQVYLITLLIFFKIFFYKKHLSNSFRISIAYLNRQELDFRILIK